MLLKEIFWLRDGVLDSNSRNPCWHASLFIKIHDFFTSFRFLNKPELLDLVDEDKLLVRLGGTVSTG